MGCFVFLILNDPYSVFAKQVNSKQGSGLTSSLLDCNLRGLVTKSCPTLATPRTVARQAPLSMGFSRQEHWRGVPCPSPGGLPDPGLNPGLLHCRLTLWTELRGKPHNLSGAGTNQSCFPAAQQQAWHILGAQ